MPVTMGINLTDTQDMVLRAITPHSSANPISNLQLTRQLNFKPRDTGKEGADMRSVINALRVKGFPICANGKGYFYAYTDHDLGKYIGELDGRIAKMQEASEGLSRAYPLVANKIIKH